MRLLPVYLSSAASLILCHSAIASPGAKVSTDFVASGGFTDGGAISFKDGIFNAQGPWTAIDTAGAGFATSSNGAFERFTTSTFDVAAGETMQVVAEFRTTGAYNGTGGTGLTNNQFSFGVDNDQSGGSAAVELGTVLRYSGASNFVMRSDAGATATGTDFDVTAAVADYGLDAAVSNMLRVTASITKTTTLNQFTVDLMLEDLSGLGATIATSTATYEHADLYAASTLNGVFRIAGVQSTIGWLSTDVDNVSITVVPEPNSYAMLAGIFALTVMCVRRRTHESGTSLS